jgi:hypothetical protein
VPGEWARFGAEITAAGFAENFLQRKIDNVITQVLFACPVRVDLLPFNFFFFSSEDVDSVNKFLPINLFACEPERDGVAPVR